MLSCLGFGLRQEGKARAEEKGNIQLENQYQLSEPILLQHQLSFDYNQCHSNLSKQQHKSLNLFDTNINSMSNICR